MPGAFAATGRLVDERVWKTGEPNAMASRDSLMVAVAEVCSPELVWSGGVVTIVAKTVVVCGQPGGKLILELVELPVDVLLVVAELVVVEVVELP